MNAATMSLTLLLALAPEGAEKKADPGPAVAVTLQEAGAEPRRAVRYRFEVGKKETLVMDVKMTVSLSMAGVQQPPMTLPTTRTILLLEIRELTPDGAARIAFRVTDVEVQSDSDASALVVQAIRGQITQMKGLVGTMLLTARGVTEDLKVTPPPTAGPQVAQHVQNLEQQFRGLTPSFPEEPVGIGARWQVTTKMRGKPVSLDQTATYRLVALDGNAGRTEFSVTQSAPRQPLEDPSLPAGITATLESMKSEGSGTTAFSLDSLVATVALTAESSMASTIVMGGQEQKMSVSTKSSTRTGPRPPEKAGEAKTDP